MERKQSPWPDILWLLGNNKNSLTYKINGLELSTTVRAKIPMYAYSNEKGRYNMAERKSR